MLREKLESNHRHFQRDRQRVINRIMKLAEDPRREGCEKLSGQDRYRVRQGRYRILYTINDEE